MSCLCINDLVWSHYDGAEAAPPTKDPKSRALPIQAVRSVIEAEKNSTAVLECVTMGLDNYYTVSRVIHDEVLLTDLISLKVSWIRAKDVKVLAVGGFVFSTDQRMTVTSTNTDVDRQSIWTLEIRNLISEDAGRYKCQVNTEPAESVSITLNVLGKGFLIRTKLSFGKTLLIQIQD